MHECIQICQGDLAEYEHSKNGMVGGGLRSETVSETVDSELHFCLHLCIDV